MRILSIDYPKTQKETDKIDHLVNCYNKILKQEIEIEMKEHIIVVNDLNKKEIYTTSFCN